MGGAQPAGWRAIDRVEGTVVLHPGPMLEVHAPTLQRWEGTLFVCLLMTHDCPLSQENCSQETADAFPEGYNFLPRPTPPNHTQHRQ